MRTSTSYIPAGMFADPGWLLDQVAALFSGAGTVIVPRVPGPYYTADWEHLPYGEQLRECARLAGERGWSTTDTAAEHGYGWLTWTKTGAPTVHMGILPMIAPAGDQLVCADDPPEVQADLLARYHQAVGVPWMSTAGVTGVNLARKLYERTVRRPGKGEERRRQPVWIERLDDESLICAGDIMWSRHRTAEEMAHAIVARWDVRMQYGAAAGVAELPVDRLRESTGPTEFDPAAAGYWRIAVPDGAWWARNGESTPPVVNPARVRADGTVALTTPLVALLYEMGQRPEVLDSRTTTHTDRVLREWYERLRDARLGLNSPKHPEECRCPECELAAAVKSTANSAVGMMGSGRGRIQRKVWQHTVQDLARANMLRKLRSAQGYIGWPFRIEHDSVWYAVPQASEGPRFDVALGVHHAMGRFRFVGAWDREEYEQTRRAELDARRARIRERRAAK